MDRKKLFETALPILIVLFLFLFPFVLLFVEFEGQMSEFREQRKEIREFKVEFDSLKGVIGELRGEKMAVIYVPTEAFFCGERVPLENYWVRKKFIEQLKLYTTTAGGRGFIEFCLREVEGTLPYVEKEALRRGLPSDLKYVPVVESGLSDKARSSAGALGRWQFMRGSAKEEGLTINKNIDERKHFEKATRAALGKFASEYRIFNRWFLTLAAYNGGVKRIREALREQPSAQGSYFNLDLTRETAEYCYKLVAIKYILENPERYGFNVEPYRGVEIEIREYKLKKSVKVVDVARKFGVSPAEFRELNRWIEGDILPAGTHHLRLPKKHPPVFADSVSVSPPN